MTIFSTPKRERIFAILYVTTMLAAGAMIMTLMIILTAQNAMPHAYNNWVKDHPEYHMFVLVQEPKVTIGNAGATRDIDISEYYGFFYDSERKCWAYIFECWGTDEFIVENPERQLEPVYMYITLNSGCRAHISTQDASGYIQLSLDPLE